jgi:hypothetical protein
MDNLVFSSNTGLLITQMNSSIFSAGIYSSVFPGYNSLFWIELDMDNTRRDKARGLSRMLISKNLIGFQ